MQLCKQQYHYSDTWITGLISMQLCLLFSKIGLFLSNLECMIKNTIWTTNFICMVSTVSIAITYIIKCKHHVVFRGHNTKFLPRQNLQFNSLSPWGHSLTQLANLDWSMYHGFLWWMEEGQRYTPPLLSLCSINSLLLKRQSGMLSQICKSVYVLCTQ